MEGDTETYWISSVVRPLLKEKDIIGKFGKKDVITFKTPKYQYLPFVPKEIFALSINNTELLNEQEVLAYLHKTRNIAIPIYVIFGSFLSLFIYASFRYGERRKKRRRLLKKI